MGSVSQGRPDELVLGDPVRDELVQIVDAAMASAALRSGRHLACRAGCAQCCHGVFAISQQDAARLRAGLEWLAAADPGRAARVRERVRSSVERLAAGFPGDTVSGLLPDLDDPANEAVAEAFEEFANDEPCPVLDPETLTCDLYRHRPVLCRTFGPPMQTPEGHLGHCELCFTEATPEEVLAAVVDPAMAEAWEASDAVYDAEHRLAGTTLIAFALRDA